MQSATPSSPPPSDPGAPHVAALHALYTGADRGLAADLLAGRALGLHVLPVCTSLVVASRGRVTDVNDVPADTVAAQLEHLRAVVPIDGVKVGILGDHRTVHAAFDAFEEFAGPIVLDFIASGPSGETVLTTRGIDALSERMGRADLVMLRRVDAELVTGGEIGSLDDAQVAAQRAVNRGARRVLIKCGDLPARFHEAADDPEEQSTGFHSDLLYDGEDFALFEAPALESSVRGASSIHGMATLKALLSGRGLEESLQFAKRVVTDALRNRRENGFNSVVNYESLSRAKQM